MKKVITILAAIMAFSGTAQAQTYTGFNHIEKISVNGNSTVAGYYFWNQSSGFTGVDCAGVTPTYGFVNADSPGAKAMFSLAMMAKAQGNKVQFQGECNSNGSYFNVTQIVLD